MTFPYKLSNFQRAARAVLMQDEGVRHYPYPDTKGNWTIGVGHYIGPKLDLLRWDYDDCMYFLDKDIKKHVDDLHFVFGEEVFESFPVARQAALLSLAFTMKRNSLLGFERLIAAAKGGDWDSAAKEALDSKWAHDVDPKQIPDQGRDNRVAYMLKTAKFHPDYNL